MIAMSKIRIGVVAHEKHFLLSSKEGQSILRQAKSDQIRPICLCSANSPELYIGRRAGTYYLARMPGTAERHANGCASHVIDCSQPPTDELSASAVLGLVFENFPVGDMNKKGWVAIRDWIQRSITGIQVDGVSLSENLLLPEFFDSSSSDRLSVQYNSFISSRTVKRGVDAPRCWVLAPFKSISPSKYSHRATLKHMPTFKFWVHNEVAVDITGTADSSGTTLCLFSCRSVTSGVEVDEAATFFLPDLPAPVTDDEIRSIFLKLNLPPSTSRDTLLALLVRERLAQL